MNILVAYASKHGSTRQIAETIATVLRLAGNDVDLSDVATVEDVDDYDAVVLGSAVYGGTWYRPAREFVGRQAFKLARRPVWLFSSGPIGDPPKPDADQAVQISQYMVKTHAKEHQLFNGKLDKHQLTFAERAIVLAVHAKEGDFRDWEAIRAWSAHIATRLTKLSAESLSPSGKARSSYNYALHAPAARLVYKH